MKPYTSSLVAFVLSIWMSPLCCAVSYSVTDLGTVGGPNAEEGTNSYAYGINASGQVVGTSFISANNVTHAFLYSGGTMQDLGTLGGRQSYAYGINASGQVVGYQNLAGNR